MMKDQNPYEVIAAEVLEVIQESPRIKTFVMKPEKEFHFRTGQFIEVTVPGVGEAPFTPSCSHYQNDILEVTIMDTGLVTHHLHQKIGKGDVLGIRGPYGSAYPLDRFKNQNIVILGGGVGLAPLRSLLLSMLHDSEDYQRIWVCFGCRTPEDFIYKTQFDDWAGHKKVALRRSVDKVPEGQCWLDKVYDKVCLVPGLLDEVDLDAGSAIAVVCGPPIMMKYGTLALLKKGFRDENIYLSMEKKMYCGIGQCRHCMIDGYYACKDGPVFTYAQLKDKENIWE
jgi:NAD(P)H-flavin reductase